MDLGGSLAVASRGLFSTGVSTDLNVTYLSSGGKIGDTIKAEALCDKCLLDRLHSSLVTDLILVGKTLAFTSIRFMDKSNTLVARGSHTKYVALAQKDPKNMVDALKPTEGES